jgi:hypothetical protein
MGERVRVANWQIGAVMPAAKAEQQVRAQSPTGSMKLRRIHRHGPWNGEFARFAPTSMREFARYLRHVGERRNPRPRMLRVKFGWKRTRNRQLSFLKWSRGLRNLS